MTTKKNKKPATFEDFFPLFNSYVERRLAVINENEGELSKLQEEKSELERNLNLYGISMSAAEYKDTDTRLNRVIDEIHICEEREALFKNTEIATQAEIEKFETESRQAYIDMMAAAEAEIYEHLKELVPIAEKYNTELVKLFKVRAAFGAAVDHGVTGGLVPLPDLLVYLNRILICDYSDYDKKVNEGKGVTDGLINEDLATANKALFDSGWRIGVNGSVSIDLFRPCTSSRIGRQVHGLEGMCAKHY